MVNDIIVIYRNKETTCIVILITSKRYYSHPKNQILNFSLP